MNSIVKRAAALVVMMVCMTNTHAQEAMTSDLDNCINSEKMSHTVKGAAVGAITGLLGSFMSGKNDKAGQAALVGAVAGGAIGYATAYYKAAGICMERNPSWIPESNIQRNPNYKAIVSEFKYKPNKGNFSFVRKLKLPQTVNQGESLEVKASFVVLTSDGGEAQIKIVRKLFAIADNKEEEVPFYGKGEEERIVDNGEHNDTFNLPIDKEVPVGAKFRIEYRLSLKGDPFISESATVEVK